MTSNPTPKTGFWEGGKGRSKAQKRAILFRQQRGRCAICGSQMSLTMASLDHIVPRKHRGTNKMSNLRLAHKTCNNERGASMADLFVDLIGLRALRWNVKELP